jgi:AsmA family protein
MNKRIIPRFLRCFLLLLAGTLGLFLIAATTVTLMRVPLDLSAYRVQLETSVSQAIGREVTLEGDIVVTTSLWPYFKIKDLRIANPGGHEAGDLLTIDRLRISVGLVPLLQRKIRIHEFHVDGLSLNLVRAPGGGGNWVFESIAGTSEDVEAGGSGPRTLEPDDLSVDRLLLEDIHISFRDGDSAPLDFEVERAEGAAAAGRPMQLSMNGVLLQEPFNLDIKANSLVDFLGMTRSQLVLLLDIADTRLAFSGLSEALRGGRESRLQLLVEGEDLSSLDDLLHLDLPPIEKYQVKADLEAVPGQLRLSALEIRVGESILQGRMLYDRTGRRPFADLDLTARLVQLDDFDTGEWTAEAEEPVTDTTATEPADTGEALDRAKLLGPAALARADGRLKLEVQEVLSGKDRLGSGEMRLQLKDGRMSLDPLSLSLPSASLLVKASLKPGETASDASLRILLRDFDIGVLARLSNPESDIGGTLSLDIDITAAASNTRNILSGANGYFDIAAHPKNLSAGVVDLWAVNLLSEVVTSSAQAEGLSNLNCLIGRFSLKDGVMKADNLAVDTSRIRICGRGRISFADDTFKLVASPKAKRPEFFSLATPLKVDGKFDDFRIGLKGGALSLGTTATRFVISPITTPIERIFKRDIPDSGADMCYVPIGPHEGKLEPLPGC